MRFPIFALIAPLVTSVVLWLVTGSAYTLLFALLGPVMALAQFADGKLQTRKSQKQTQQKEEEQAVAERSVQKQEAAARREELLRKYPPSHRWALDSHALRPAWAASAQPEGTQRSVRVGLSVREGEPVLVDVRAGIALSGPDIEVRSVMRAIGFQLLWIWGVKEMYCIGWDVSQEPELTKLGESHQSSQQILLHRRRSAEAFPPGVRYDLAVDRGRAILRDLVDPLAHEIILEADLLTRAESNRIIDVLVREVEAHKDSSPPVVKIPEQVDAIINTTAEWDRSRDTLVAFLGRKHEHPLLLDLVQAGPHAVVTGMTGSGKTEFLISWLTSLAAMYPPDRLSLMLIDYKGGAGFSKLHDLPHVVGVLTDLTPEQTQRAVTSLRAEIRFREQQLAEAAVADISDLPEGVDLARLVIVVDEFRVLTQAMPECAELFVDIAARGRSLGIHLIASSQRTGGVISDAILANCSIRVSFRVSDKADSTALLGTEDAFHLPHLPGRAVMKATGIPLSEFHAARLGEKDFSQVLSKAQKWTEQSPQWSAHVPWQPELPYDLPAHLMPPAMDHAAWLGLLDIPEHQVQNWTPYLPSRDGNLVITGPARSGVTTTVVALHAQLGGLFINDAEIAWDAVCEQADSLLRPGVVVCIEDLDHILDCMSHEHREHFITSLSRLVRVAPQRGAVFILGCKPNPRGARTLLELFPATLELSSST